MISSIKKAVRAGILSKRDANGFPVITWQGELAVVAINLEQKARQRYAAALRRDPESCGDERARWAEARDQADRAIVRWREATACRDWSYPDI